jgi:hypothetical protein
MTDKHKKNLINDNIDNINIRDIINNANNNNEIFI